jgi:hypothetical protein
LIITIAEVVDIVSLNSVFTILKSTIHCSLSSSSEVSFQGRGASIKNTNLVGIFSPSFSESIFKETRESFEGFTFRSSNDSHLEELFMSNLSTENRLNNVSSIKTIHATSSYDSLLSIRDSAGVRVNLISLVEAIVKFSEEVIKDYKLVLDEINQLR